MLTKVGGPPRYWTAVAFRASEPLPPSNVTAAKNRAWLAAMLRPALMVSSLSPVDTSTAPKNCDGPGLVLDDDSRFTWSVPAFVVMVVVPPTVASVSATVSLPVPVAIVRLPTRETAPVLAVGVVPSRTVRLAVLAPAL